MTKIAHLSSVHPHGDTRIFHKECRTLTCAGYDVVFVVPHDQDEEIDGVRIRAVPRPGNRLERMLQTTRQVYQIARAENADLYHFHDPELIPAGWWLSMRGKPVIYDVHEDYATSIGHKTYLPYLLRRPLAAAWGTLEKLLTRPMAIVLAERYYAERFPHGTLVLNYPRKEHFPGKTSRNNRNLRLLYSGVVTEDRGALIHSRLVALLDQVEVYVVGRCTESLADEMRRAAGRGVDRLHIEAVGEHVSFQRILDYYRQGDWLAGLAIFPPHRHYLRKELTKFFEYMGAGIPIICSDFPAWQALIQDTGAGLCVDPLDPEAAARAIRYLMEHPQQAEEMGAHGRRAFETRYNWDSEADKLKGLYGSLLR
jgi:glycosyltransferase involved in cell wall biosynthesis